MKEMEIMTRMIETITKGMMAADTSTKMITAIDVEDFKIKKDILGIEKINHVDPFSVIHA